jgi:hypothetical protein
MPSMRIRSFLLAVLIPLTTAAAAQPGPVADREHEFLGARHYILEPQHVLGDAERAELAAEGVQIQKALSGGRYLVRIAKDSPVDDSDPRVRHLAAFSVADKLHRSAYRAATKGVTFARLRVLFHDDVTFNDAISAVEAAGGAPEQTFGVDFGPLRSMTVHVPAVSLEKFAADERVMMVYGAVQHKAISYNIAAAALSHVDAVQAAPYNLTGKDVIISYFELAPPDTTHPEFEGRVITHIVCQGTNDADCQSVSNRQHATHVAGTMVAKGINPAVKGMAPEAIVHQYRGADPDDQWLIDKDLALKALGGVGDNNSWGYTVGWCAAVNCGGTTGWVWTDDDELLGGYDGFVSAVIDHAAIDNQTLMLHAAGNEGSNNGPGGSPYPHNHLDNRGKVTNDIWCYSKDGSGTDCPLLKDFTGTVVCSSNVAFCEKTKHPVRNPYGSINWLASEKNVLSVGATDFQPAIANFSSRGPTKDFRVKPELTAKGQSLLSTFPGNTYAREQGTSMSTPVTTGTIALLTQQWRITTGNPTGRPSPVMLKAVAIAGAEDLGLPGPDVTYGYGFLNAKKSVDLIIADGGSGKRIRTDSATQGAQFDYPVTLTSAGDLRVVLTWFDPEALPLGSDQITTSVLINDLDLKVVGPDSTTTLPYALVKDDPCYANDTSNGIPTCKAAIRAVNNVDNNEEVEVKNAAAGTYHIIVKATRVTANPPQSFVVVTNGDLGVQAAPCVDATEPNDTPAGAYGPLTLSSQITAAICSDSDVDNFKFTTNGVGPVSVTLGSVDTPLTVTISGPGVTTLVKNITAGSNNGFGTLTTTAAASQVNIEVKLNGTRGATGVYNLHVDFPFNAPPRRRPVKHDVVDGPTPHDGVQDPAGRRN